MTSLPLRLGILCLTLACLNACSVIPKKWDPSKELSKKEQIVAKDTARIRGLKLPADLKISTKTPEQVREVMREDLEELWEKDGELNERAYKVFGLLPPELDTKKWLTEFLTEQVAGYYDPRTKELNTISDPNKMDIETDLELPDRMANRPLTDEEKKHWAELSKITGRYVLAHELTHAIDDAKFDLAAKEKAIKSNDDKSLAYLSVIEGSAMETSADYFMDQLGLPMSAATPIARNLIQLIASANPEGLQFFYDNRLRNETKDKSAKDKSLLDSAPPILKAELLFPYMQGWAFVNEVRSQYGWQAVNKLHDNPPASSEQIAFPEKYLDRSDLPVEIELLEAPAGFEANYQQTMGYLRTRILLSSKLGDKRKDYARGWDGDRYVLWSSKDKEGIAWVSYWETESAAKKFERQYSRVLTQEHSEIGPWSLQRDKNKVSVVLGLEHSVSAMEAERMLGSKVTIDPKDKNEEHWLLSTALWPISTRNLNNAWQFNLLGGNAMHMRFHRNGHKAKLLWGWLLHTESTPERLSLWTALGLVGYSSDTSTDYSFFRIPIAMNWHGRGKGEERRSNLSLALDSVRYRNEEGQKEFSLLWGGLLKTKWGKDVKKGERFRFLFIPFF